MLCDIKLKIYSKSRQPTIHNTSIKNATYLKQSCLHPNIFKINLEKKYIGQMSSHNIIIIYGLYGLSDYICMCVCVFEEGEKLGKIKYSKT